MPMENRKNPYFKIGVAKRKITPQKPVCLAGFASRKGRLCEGVKEDIWVRVLRIADEKEEVIFVHGDLIWWDPDMADIFRKRIARQAGCDISQVILTATHNHSGPATGNSFVPELGTADPEYIAYLMEETLTAVKRSEEDMIFVSCQVREGIGNFNVYRRKKTDQGILMMPEYEKKPDNRLSMITFEDKEGTLKAFGIHYACHASLCGENQIFTDYPGLALKLLEENHPDVFGFFWQGCTADLRPNCVLGTEFLRCDYEKAYGFTKQFVNTCENILKKPGRIIVPDVRYREKKVLLPVTPPKNEFRPEKMKNREDSLMHHWAESVLKRRNTDLKTVFCRVQLGEGLVFYGVGAEVAQDYGKYVQSLEKGALCCGYTNGMSGYLCTAKQIKEGGYEPEESALYFGVDGTFSEKIELVLKETFQELSEENRKEESV